MTMDSKELENRVAKWLKLLSRKERAVVREGIAAGRKWGESRSYNAVQAVVAFGAVAFRRLKASDVELWDSEHDGAFDHCSRLMEEAVGDDDAEFNDAMEDWGNLFQLGWFHGVGLAYAEIIEAGGSRCLVCGGVVMS
jgi:hypothetical protein